MSLLAWILLTVVALVGLGLAALTDHAARRRGGLLALSGAVGCLLLVLGADVLASLWLLMVLPLVWLTDQREVTPAPASGGGQRLAGGVLTAGLGGALYDLTQRIDWLALPAHGFRAQAADLAGRLLADDLVVVVGLLLVALALLGAGGLRPTAAHTRDQGADHEEVAP